MKFRLKSSSIAWRSIFLGQVQSKSTIGLVAPTCASRARRSKPRFCRSRSSMARTSRSQGLSMISSQQPMRPNSPRALRRVFNSVGVSSVVMAAILLEGVVGRERVRGDDEVAVLAGSKREADGRWQAAVGAALVDHLAHGADVDGVALEDFDERVFECVGSRAIEQLQQPRGVAAEIFAALGQAAKERLAAGRGLGETVEPAVLASAFPFED